VKACVVCYVSACAVWHIFGIWYLSACAVWYVFVMFPLLLFGTFLVRFRLCCLVHFATFPLVLFGTFLVRQCVIHQESALSHVNEL